MERVGKKIRFIKLTGDEEGGGDDNNALIDGAADQAGCALPNHR